MSSVNKEPESHNPYWRSVNELEGTPEFQRYVEREFPYLDEETATGSVNRRQFLQLMSASMALGGLTACRRPVNHIVPYVRPPEDVIPGVPLYYATTMPFGEEAFGLVVESHEGRPTKIEGNPDHPATLGKSSMQVQASILGLYDPNRSPRTLRGGQPAEWKDFAEALTSLTSGLGETGGDGLAVLSEATSSPTVARLKRAIEQKYPKLRWVAYEALGSENAHEGTALATGTSLRPLPHFDKADTILALDADFLMTEENAIRNSYDFANRRDPDMPANKSTMNRLYVAEPAYTVTGGMADHRLRLKASRIAAVAVAVAKALGVNGVTDLEAPAGELDPVWIENAVEDLRRAGSHGLVVAGRRQPAAVHALVAAINHRLGSIGTAVTYVEPLDTIRSDMKALRDLTADMADKKISTLFILGGNPVYNAPADLDFGKALGEVGFTAHLSELYDATSERCLWHISRTNFLESWGDARALDGTLSLVQPLIAPLHADSHSDLTILNLIATGEEATAHDLVRESWAERFDGAVGFETNWKRLLHDGVLKNSSYRPAQVTISADGIRQAVTTLDLTTNEEAIEVVFGPSTALHDGRFANNGWLQEVPDPITKITWDNAAIVSPTTARKLGAMRKLNKLGELKFDMIDISIGGASLALALYIQPGHADNCISLALGYGRPEAEAVLSVGHGVGFNTYLLRTTDAAHIVPSVEVRKSIGTYELAITQDHHSMEGRPLVREAELTAFKENGKLYPEAHYHEPHQLWEPPVDYSKGYQWGMTIDLNRCTGCSACTIACQSENNIPVIGKTQVGKGREMHWIRVDRYYKGPIEDPQGVVMQPVPCQHCENAPCEQVCPVTATTHDHEGLNTMVYNRCIGTRYCSNNCPYKVRRFNFFNYTKDIPETVQMAMNPDVTVRFRGVMEKCTYCTQRINQARITSKVDGREIRAGDVQTACQQACPVNAISFGNINNEKERVTALKRNPRNYQILQEINTRPRTSYLGRMRNSNEHLAPDDSAANGHEGH